MGSGGRPTVSGSRLPAWTSGPVRVWHIASPVDPDAPPRAVRYPQAGTDNADVSLSVLGLDGSRVDVDWDRDAFPYLVEVTWNDRCPLTLLVLSRDQKRWLVLEVDPDSGKTQTLFDDTAEHWQTIVTGVPDRLSDGRLVFVGGDARTPVGSRSTASPSRRPGLQVAIGPRRRRRRPLRGAGRSHRAARVARARAARLGSPERLTTEPGVHTAARAGDLMVVVSDLLIGGCVGRACSGPAPSSRRSAPSSSRP